MRLNKMVFIYSFFSLFLGHLAHAQTAEDIQVVKIIPLKAEGMGLRDTWDKTKQFCYEESSTQKCFDIVQLGEITIRKDGNWSSSELDQAYINALSPQERDTASLYQKLVVRYLAINDSKQFVVHIFFLKNGEHKALSKTIFAFGDIRPGNDVHIHSMTFSNDSEKIGAQLSKQVEFFFNKGKLPSDASVDRQIAHDNLTLLKVGAKTVQTFINSENNPNRLP